MTSENIKIENAGTRKKTQREYYAQLETCVLFNNTLSDDDSKELLEFIKDRIAALDLRDKKAKASRDSKKLENDITDIVLDGLKAQTTPVTLTTLKNNTTALANVSIPKITACITRLVKDGTVIRTEEKRKAYFQLSSNLTKTVCE